MLIGFHSSIKTFTLYGKRIYFLFLLLFFNVNVFAAQEQHPFLFNPLDFNVSNYESDQELILPNELGMFKDYSKLLDFLIDKKHGEFSVVDSIMNSSAIDQKLSYLPLIISGYKRRNKGIWNLNYITGSSNLQINHYIDERLDVKKSTICAIAYLKFLKKKYKSNNWVMLAFLTSPSYVSNVLNSSNSNKWEEGEKYIDEKYLNNIRLLNWISISAREKSNKRAKINVKTPKKYLYTFSCNLFFDALSQFKKIDFEEVLNDNPVLINQFIPKEYPIHLKKRIGNFIENNLKEIVSFQDSMIGNLYFKKVSRDRSFHVVVQGDILGQIAIDNHVTVKDLMKWNNLKNTTIYQGQKLVLVEKGIFSKETLPMYKISDERFFWEILKKKNYLTIKDLCNYNTYQELKPQQLLIIKEK
ncbi:MAG: LysM peptidoglycan-binding domain-containing protein [Flavobacteriales bacterium]|nr:LysM peptidoglycan-binding domain-containing protein [Flavobacteriales bacterium]